MFRFFLFYNGSIRRGCSKTRVVQEMIRVLEERQETIALDLHNIAKGLRY